MDVARGALGGEDPARGAAGPGGIWEFGMYWRKYFTEDIIARGEELRAGGAVTSLRQEDDLLTWSAIVRDLTPVRVVLRLDGQQSLLGGGCSCLKGTSGSGCAHIAAVCAAVEARLDGVDPWEWETPTPPRPAPSRAASDGRDPAPFRRLAGSGEYHYFDLNHITRSLDLTPIACREGRRLHAAGGVSPDEPPSFDTAHEYAPGRGAEEPEAYFYATVREQGEPYRVFLHFDKNEIRTFQCGCGDQYSAARDGRGIPYSSGKVCRHGMAALYYLEDYILRENPGDATDLEALRLQREMEDRGQAGEKEKSQILRLEPELETDGWRFAARFKAGTGRLYLLRDLGRFVSRFENGEKESYGKSTVIDYKACELDEGSARLYRFIKDAIASERCRDRDWRSELENGTQVSGMTIRGSILLTGAALDEFYDLIRDRQVGYFCRGHLPAVLRHDRGTLSCRDGELRGRFTVERRTDGKGEFEGVTVNCRLPAFAEGLRSCYRLTNDHYLERIPKESMEDILPLCRALDDWGNLQFHVGRGHLAWFSRDLLPILRDHGDVTENDSELIDRYVPPEPVFRFYLDAEDGDLTCRVSAVYGETEVNASDLLRRDGGAPPARLRDERREREILDRVREYFPKYDEERDQLVCREESGAYRVISQAVQDLTGLGEVNCTEQFLRLRVRPAANFTVGVSLGSGLLDLDISSEGVPPEDLPRVLDAYRRKKRYVRLRNGDFLRTDGGEGSAEALSALLDDLRVTPGEFVKGKMQIPAYRALYLDRMLEESGEIYAARDSRFRDLVEGFGTAAGAGFKVPESLGSTLRGYQAEGYRFLRTLEAYDLGGILADDMGLGKTLQMISVFLAWKEEGKHDPSLVVCPASLVYNWGEEIERFAPQLEVALVVGTQKERGRLLRDHRRYDVLVTSYELLKRDIDSYEACRFRGQVLDEAQVIKNHNTAAAKSVKLIRSRYRFALTGTPIENRLSELWSVFDFLMPGFLYSYDTFRKEIEIPVVKHGDKKAAERLRRMVSPFILRRLKKDVLEDLPEKIEEVVRVKADRKQQLLCDGQVAHIREMLASQDDETFQKERMRSLAELTRLREICCDPSLLFEDYDGGSAKREACLELIDQAMEGGHRMLIFSQFTSMLALLEEDLRKAGIDHYKIIGATPKEERLSLVHDFNEGNTPVFLISLRAGGTGLNLTGADVVIHYDPWWNLAVQEQATDRAHRIGQTRVVTEYKLILKGSVEEKILKLQEEKSDLAERILSGEGSGGLGSLSREDLLELLGV